MQIVKECINDTFLYYHYIHCYRHRLKLVIDELLENVSGVADHFSLASDLYAFFKLTEINKIYTGVKLKRLIETRWSGHFKSIEVIYSESDKIIKCLKGCLNSATIKYGTKVQAQGYLKVARNPHFILFNKILYVIFACMNIATCVLQGKSTNLLSVMQIGKECINDTYSYMCSTR